MSSHSKVVVYEPFNYSVGSYCADDGPPALAKYEAEDTGKAYITREVLEGSATCKSAGAGRRLKREGDMGMGMGRGCYSRGYTNPLKALDYMAEKLTASLKLAEENAAQACTRLVEVARLRSRYSKIKV